MHIDMRPSYFTYGGISSKDYNVKITSVNYLDAPAKIAKSIHIPGRNGNIEEEDGSYENFRLKINCYCEGDPAIYLDGFRSKLMATAGYHELWLDGLPNEFRLATLKSAWEVGMMDHTGGTMSIVFNCKPQRFLPEGKEPVRYLPSGTVVGTGELMTYDQAVEALENAGAYDAGEKLIKTWYTHASCVLPGRYQTEKLRVEAPCGYFCIGVVDQSGSLTPFVQTVPTEGRAMVLNLYVGSSKTFDFYFASGLGQKVYYGDTLVYSDGSTEIVVANDNGQVAKPYAHLHNTSGQFGNRWANKAVYGINQDCVITNDETFEYGGNEDLFIDSEIETALVSVSVSDTSYSNRDSAGKYIYDMNFPVLKPGTNVVYFKNIDYLDLTTRWWRL